MKKIAVINQKGGSGKTTTTANLGAALTKLKKRVLLVDMDPQAHLTQSVLGAEALVVERGTYDVLSGDIAPQEALIKTKGLQLIPSSLDLAAGEIEFASIHGREVILKEALKGLRGFDFVLIDCPPSLGLLTVISLTAASGILVPLQVEFLALHSLSKLLKTIDLVKKRLNSRLDISGILVTRYDKRKRLNREVMEGAKKHFGDKLYKTYIRENISLAEAPSYGESIFEYSAKSHGAADYMAFAKEFLKKEGAA